MHGSASGAVGHLVDRHPSVSPERLIAQLRPPPMFAEVSFATYRPDPAEPTQAAAVVACKDFCQQGVQRRAGHGKQLGKLFRKRAGFIECIDLLADYTAVCIDEFELDDPGNTTLIARLLSSLVERGVSVAATSNTLPEQLGEGRFAAQDFLREINTLAEIFSTVRIAGPDYRHRDLPPAPPPLSDERVAERAARVEGATLDDFDALCAHLATMHPSRYLALIEGVTAVFLTGVYEIDDQNVALRLVSLTDRLYDAGIPVLASGAKLDSIFGAEMLTGGYRKKYLRATSRLLALTQGLTRDRES